MDERAEPVIDQLLAETEAETDIPTPES